MPESNDHDLDQKMRDYWRIVDPGTSPARVAELVAKWHTDWAGAGHLARRRLDGGVPLADVSETARLLLSAAEPPGGGALSFAAAVAHAEGDEDAEHRYTRELIARAEGEGCPPLDVARLISGLGHPGEGIELVEPHLRDHPDSQDAADTYAVMLREAAEMAEPGEKERAALGRFTDRSGFSAVKGGIKEFLDRTRWGTLVEDRAVTAFQQVPAKVLPAAEVSECAALALETAVWGTLEEAGSMTHQQLIELFRDGLVPDTPLTAFAADSQAPPDLARRASDWAEHGIYGLWQLIYPDAKPGVWGRELISGIQKYLQFPPEILDGVPKWSVWLGGALPVDGVWRVTGSGAMLSPAEGDAVAATVDQAVNRTVMTLSGMPLAEMLPVEPIPFGKAPPWGVRWENFNSLGTEYAKRAGGVLMMLSAQIAGQVFRRRMRYGLPDAVMPDDEAWVERPLPVLEGRTPLEAAEADVPWQMLLESQLRQFEYRGADTSRLRTALGWGAEE